jgi:hypothetical protein
MSMTRLSHHHDLDGLNQLVIVMCACDCELCFIMVLNMINLIYIGMNIHVLKSYL